MAQILLHTFMSILVFFNATPQQQVAMETDRHATIHWGISFSHMLPDTVWENLTGIWWKNTAPAILLSYLLLTLRSQTAVYLLYLLSYLHACKSTTIVG